MYFEVKLNKNHLSWKPSSIVIPKINDLCNVMVGSSSKIKKINKKEFSSILNVSLVSICKIR